MVSLSLNQIARCRRCSQHFTARGSVGFCEFTSGFLMPLKHTVGVWPEPIVGPRGQNELSRWLMVILVSSWLEEQLAEE